MTIIYAEKGHGLHQAVADAGHTLVQLGLDWVSSNDVAVQAIIDSYTLDQAKAAKCGFILAKAKALRDRAIAAVSAGEMASWPIKRAEAEKYAAGDTNCPMLTSEATVRGITLAELVAKVQANTAKFQALEAAIGGNDGKHRDAVMKLSTFSEVELYDYSAGWPEV